MFLICHQCLGVAMDISHNTIMDLKMWKLQVLPQNITGIALSIIIFTIYQCKIKVLSHCQRTNHQSYLHLHSHWGFFWLFCSVQVELDFLKTNKIEIIQRGSRHLAKPLPQTMIVQSLLSNHQ